MIVLSDILSASLLFCSIIILFIRWLKKRDKNILILIVAFIFILFSTVTNIIEWLEISRDVDILENLFKILFLPTIILSLYIVRLKRELGNRKLSEKKFHTLFNQSYTYMALLNKEGELIELNESASNLIGSESVADQLQKSRISYLWSETKAEVGTEHFIEALERAKKNEILRYSTTILKKNGDTGFLDMSVKPIQDSSGELLYLVLEGRDISELKRIQLELENHKKNLEKTVEDKTIDLRETNKKLNEKNLELNRTLQYLKETQSQLIQSEKMASLGILTAGVAHEINNPLHYILGGFTGLENILKEKNLTDDEDTQLFLESIQTGIDRVSSIVLGLNQFSRDKDGMKEICDIHAILNSCQLMLLSEYKHRILIEKEYRSKEIIINGNVGKMHQIFINILNNAIQAIPETGTIKISTEESGSDAIISILDSGTGIEEKYMGRVLDPFFTTKDPGEGTGLGLSITHSLVKEFGGSLSIHSDGISGTEVRLVFPKEVANE